MVWAFVGGTGPLALELDSASSEVSVNGNACWSVVSDGCHALIEAVGGPIGWTAGREVSEGAAAACLPVHEGSDGKDGGCDDLRLRWCVRGSVGVA